MTDERLARDGEQDAEVSQNEVGRVTLNLSGEEAKQLYADLDHIVNLSAESDMDDLRRSIYQKLEDEVWRSANER